MGAVRAKLLAKVLPIVYFAEPHKPVYLRPEDDGGRLLFD